MHADLRRAGIRQPQLIVAEYATLCMQLWVFMKCIVHTLRLLPSRLSFSCANLFALDPNVSFIGFLVMIIYANLRVSLQCSKTASGYHMDMGTEAQTVMEFASERRGLIPS